MEILKNHIETARGLLESGRDEFDDYDQLMAKFLRTKLHKAQFLHRILSRKMILHDFIETGDISKEKINKIKIE